MMGVRIKRYQMNQRVEPADRLMKSNLGWRMARIAEVCGFENPLY